MGLSIREVVQADRQQLANLIHFELYVHRHLDWRTPLDWIGRTPYLVAEQNQKLVAALACPPDPPEIAWLRLFASASGVSLRSTWQALWEPAREQLAEQKASRTGAIALQNWFSDLLEGSRFVLTDNVVVLLWELGTSLPAPKPSSALIRLMQPADMEAVFALDSSVFEIEWRNSRNALEIAYQQSALATVITDDQGIMGYQISTCSPIGGHLARLAVRQDAQSRGIGYALLFNLLIEFTQRGIKHVTVNTQQDNLASLALYARAGFKQTDEQYRVYQYLP